MNAPRFVAAVIALCAVSAAGCQSGAAPKAPPAAGSPSAGAKPAAAAPKAPAPVAAAPAPKAGAPSAPPANDGRISELSTERKVLAEKRQVLVDNYTQLGDTAFADSRFQDAETMYGNVLDLDPTNEHAQRRLDQVGSILGKRGPDVRNVFQESVEASRVRLQQAKAEVSNLVAQAQAKAAAGEPDASVALYDKALVIESLYPAEADFRPSVEGLKRMRDAAAKSADQAADAKRRRILREASEQTHIEAAAQRAAQRERTKTLFRKANEAIERHDYQVARNLAEEILANDPSNEDAKRLRRIAVDAGNDEMDQSYRRQLLDEWKSVFEQLGEAYTPQTDDYTFPKTWEEIQARRTQPVLSSSAKMIEDPQNRDVRNRLDSIRTSVNFTEAKLSEAVEFLHKVSGVNIVILPAATEGKSDADLTIEKLTLDTPVPISQILTLITQFRSLAWNIENGVVQITTPQLARGANVVQLYDVKDLATPVSNFPGEEINVDPKGEHQQTEEPKEPIAEFVLDNVAELIQNNVDKTVWEEGGSIEAVPPGTLVIKAPATTHAKVQQLLAGLRGAGGLEVSIETRFVTVTDNFLQEIGVDLRGLGDQTGGLGVGGKGGLATAGSIPAPITFDDVFFGGAGQGAAGIGSGADAGVFYQIAGDGDDIRARFENLYDVSLGKAGTLTTNGGLSFQGTLIDDTQLEVILRAVQKSDRSTVVIAPRLTAYNGQRANVTVLTQTSYISDFDVEIAQASQIGDPIVQTLRDGVILDLRPVVSADRRFITMELRPTVAILTRPIQTFQTTLANGPPVTIQLPELQVQRIRTTVTMPDGGTLLLGGLRFFEERRLDSTVPWLDKIPIASFFLSRKGTYMEKRNLLVLIRARILRPEENEPGTGRKL